VVVRLLKDIPKFGRQGNVNYCSSEEAELTFGAQRGHLPRRAWSHEEQVVPDQSSRIHDDCTLS